MASTPSAVGATPRVPVVASATFDVLINEYHAYLMRNSDESRAGREEMYAKLEATGFDVGYRLAQRMTRDRERLVKDIDVMKWICREFWTELFRKSTDRLQTNNRGVYVLQDFNFRWTKYISGGPGEEHRAIALKYTILPCGLIRGALAAFDMDVTVNVDVSSLPKVLFQISLKGATPGT